jgi:O-antigen/teichoic acid export membrane protein
VARRPSANLPQPAVLRPSLAIFGGLFGALLGSVVGRALMARALRPEDLGAVLLAIACASGLGGAASLGMSSAAGRRIAALRARGDEDGARGAARTAATTALVCGALAGGALFLGAPLIARLLGGAENEASTLAAAVRAMAPVAGALPLGLAAVGISRGFGRAVGRSLIRDGGGGLLRVAAAACAVALGFGVFGVAASFALAVVVAEGFFLLWCLGQGWLRMPRGPAAGRDRGLLDGLRPFAVLELLNQVGQWMDIVVLGALAPAAAVGFFGVARSVQRALEMTLSAPSHAFLPAATDAVGRGDDALLARIYWRTRLVAFALLCLPLGLCLLVPELLIALLAGETYAPAAAILRLLALVALANGLVAFMDQTLVARGRERAVALLQAHSLAAGLVLLLVLVPPLGTTGAALALLGTSLLRGGALAALVARDPALCRVRDHLPMPLLAALAATASTALVLAYIGQASQLLRGGVAFGGAATATLVLAAALVTRD